MLLASRTSAKKYEETGTTTFKRMASRAVDSVEKTQKQPLLLALRRASHAAPAPKTKACPFCAEQIQSAAIVCRHCGRDLDIASPKTAAVESPSRPQSERGPIAAGDGSYRFQVVGEAGYQDELEAIVGGRRWKGAEHECVAVLLPEPSNPYDPNAVYVLIAGRKVGYFPRKHAVAFKRALDGGGYTNGGGYTICACYARIVGGWDRGKDNRGYLGVKLDIVLPISIRAAAASAPERIDHPNIRPKQIAHGTSVKFRHGAAGVGLVVAVAFALWLASTWWTTAPQSPSISDATSRVPSLSEATAQSPSISEATAESPSISDVTPPAPSTSEVWQRVDAAVWEVVVDVAPEAPVISSVPIARPPGDVPMPRSRPRQNF